MGTERVLAPGVEIVLQVVRMAVRDQFPSLVSTLYPGVLAMVSRPSGTLDAMWLAFQTLVNNKTPAISSGNYFSVPACSNGARSSAPSGPRPTSNGRGQNRAPSLVPSWQTGSRNNPLVIKINKSTSDCLDPRLDTSSNCWPLDEHH